MTRPSAFGEKLKAGWSLPARAMRRASRAPGKAATRRRGLFMNMVGLGYYCGVDELSKSQ
jgi:hypothetical protein